MLIVCGGKVVPTEWICFLEATAWTPTETWHKTPPVRDVFVHFSHLICLFSYSWLEVNQSLLVGFFILYETCNVFQSVV